MDYRSEISVDTALAHWGKSLKESFNGWPNENLLYRIIKYGAGASHKGVGVIEMDSLCEHVDRAVSSLPKKQRMVVCSYYSHWESQKEAAKRVGMGYEAFRQSLSRARRRVEEYLQCHKS